MLRPRIIPCLLISNGGLVKTVKFKSSKYSLNDFIAPFSLNDGVRKTLHSEFIEPDPNREIFYTE